MVCFESYEGVDIVEIMVDQLFWTVARGA